MTAIDMLRTKAGKVPAVLPQTAIVDVCACLRAQAAAGALVISDRGQLRGLISETQIIRTVARLGSAVMSMQAGELVDDTLPVCEVTDSVDVVLRAIAEGGLGVVAVKDGAVVRGLLSYADAVAYLLAAAEQDTAAYDEAAYAGQAAPAAAPAYT